MSFSVKNDRTFSNLKGRFVLTPTNPIYSGLVTGDNFMVKKDIRADSIKTSSLDLIGLCDEPASKSSGFRVYNDAIVHDIVMPQTVSDELIQLTGTGGFGVSVAISGDTCIVGAPFVNSFTGVAYIYTKVNNVWGLNTTLSNPAGVVNDQFGWSVAISGNNCIIGANRVNSFTGAAYIFTKVNNEWVLESTLARLSGVSNDFYGHSVAVSGDTYIVGAYGVNSSKGAAYMYTKVNNVLVLYATLSTIGTAGDRYGFSVAISGDTFIIGAYGVSTFTGAAYIYTKVTNGLILNNTFLGNTTYNNFGYSVSVSGDTCIVGAHGVNSSTGVAYIYTKVNNVWGLNTTLSNPLGVGSDQFGWDVAIYGDNCIIGGAGVNSFTGAAYIYTKVNNVWTYNSTLLGELDSGVFGTTVAIACNTCIIGSEANKAYISEGVLYKGDIQIIH